MLGLSQQQRAVLADKVGDAANVAAGALVFSQFLSGHVLSPMFLVLGFVAVARIRRVERHDCGKDAVMSAYFIVFGIIALFALIITVLDGIGYRRPRRNAGKS